MSAPAVHPGVKAGAGASSSSDAAANRERNLDILRGIGAVAVVLLHAPPLYHSGNAVLRGVGWGIREICQVAVPLFFLISGYLSGRRSSDLPGGMRTLSRILWLYVPWFLLYLVIDLAQHNREVGPLVVLRRFVGLGVEGASTSGYHLWFLPAMFWGFLGLRISCKWFGNSIPALLLGLLIYCLVGWISYPDGSLPWKSTAHEGVNLSLLFLSIGHVYGRLVATRGRPFLIGPWLVAGSILWLLIEGYLVGRLANQPFMVPPFQSGRILVPVLLLSLALSSPTWSVNGVLGGVLEKLAICSTGIYVLHLAFLEVIPFEVLVPNGFIRDNLVRWPLTLLLCVCTTLLVLRWGPKKIRHFFA
jgi:fucose 4-O-acetylase-like acetyltransferase